MDAIPAPIKLLIGAAGIFACYAYSATLTEDVYKARYGEEQEKFQYTLLTLLFWENSGEEGLGERPESPR